MMAEGDDRLGMVLQEAVGLHARSRAHVRSLQAQVQRLQVEADGLRAQLAQLQAAHEALVAGVASCRVRGMHCMMSCRAASRSCRQHLKLSML